VSPGLPNVLCCLISNLDASQNEGLIIDIDIFKIMKNSFLLSNPKT
jgi:hypothetical protein